MDTQEKRENAADDAVLKLNPKHKDNMFRLLFSAEENFLALYNAISGSRYGIDAEMKDTTLTNALTMGQLNDVSFLIDGKLIVFVEHQSTVNHNMPLRMLLYAAGVYETLIERTTLYKDAPIEVPDAEFYVIYNGEKPLKEEKMTLFLSGMRPPSRKKLPAKLEVAVDIYDISNGRNPGLKSQCVPLDEYETFVELLNKHKKATGDPQKALKFMLAECKERRILKEFLQTYASEIENMVLTEWKLEEAREVWEEEAEKRGMEKGMEKGKAEALEELFALIEKGIPLAEAKKMLLSRK